MPPETGRRRIWVSVWGLDRVSRKPATVEHRNRHSLFRRTVAAVFGIGLPEGPEPVRTVSFEKVRSAAKSPPRPRTVIASVLAVAASTVTVVVLQSAPSMTAADRPHQTTARVTPTAGPPPPLPTHPARPVPTPTSRTPITLDSLRPTSGGWSGTGEATIDGITFGHSLMADTCTNRGGITYRLGGRYQEFQTSLGIDDHSPDRPGSLIVVFTSAGRTLSTTAVGQLAPDRLFIAIPRVDDFTITWRTPTGSCPRLALGTPRLVG